MAQKKEEASKKEIVPKEIKERLPKGEKLAVQEIEESPKGTGKKYRLKDPETQYVDIETGWTLAGEQSKPLPEGYSAETLARIKKGFLVEDGKQ